MTGRYILVRHPDYIKTGTVTYIYVSNCPERYVCSSYGLSRENDAVPSAVSECSQSGQVWRNVAHKHAHQMSLHAAEGGEGARKGAGALCPLQAPWHTPRFHYSITQCSPILQPQASHYSAVFGCEFHASSLMVDSGNQSEVELASSTPAAPGAGEESHGCDCKVRVSQEEMAAFAYHYLVETGHAPAGKLAEASAIAFAIKIYDSCKSAGVAVVGAHHMEQVADDFLGRGEGAQFTGAFYEWLRSTGRA